MRLVDCFIELIAYVIRFQSEVALNQPDFEEVKAEIRLLLSQSETKCRQGTLNSADFDLARFVVCAWVDEALLVSSWRHKQLWQREQLQRLYYSTTDAGVEVFERLHNLGYQQSEVREVYYFCLSLGFKGRFIQQGDEFMLDQLIASNLEILTSNPAGIASLDTAELFPDAFARLQGTAAGFAPPRLSKMTVTALAGPVALFSVLYLIYRFALESIVGKLL